MTTLSVCCSWLISMHSELRSLNFLSECSMTGKYVCTCHNAIHQDSVLILRDTISATQKFVSVAKLGIFGAVGNVYWYHWVWEWGHKPSRQNAAEQSPHVSIGIATVLVRCWRQHNETFKRENQIVWSVSMRETFCFESNRVLLNLRERELMASWLWMDSWIGWMNGGMDFIFTQLLTIATFCSNIYICQLRTSKSTTVKSTKCCS